MRPVLSIHPLWRPESLPSYWTKCLIECGIWIHKLIYIATSLKSYNRSSLLGGINLEPPLRTRVFLLLARSLSHNVKAQAKEDLCQTKCYSNTRTSVHA